MNLRRSIGPALHLTDRRRRYDPEQSTGDPQAEANAIDADRHHGRRRTSHRERLVVDALAALGGLAAIASGADPTDIGLVDLAYLLAAGVVVVQAASRSRRWTWIVATVATVWVASGLLGRALALLAFGLAVGAAWKGRSRWIGATMGVGLVLTLGDLGAGSFQGHTTLVAAAVVSPLLASAAFHLDDQGRQTLGATVSVALAFVVVGAMLFAASAALAVGDVRSGVESARAGFDAAADGDNEVAATDFDTAAAEFGSARRLLSGFWTLPARLVPVVGQHARASQVLASEGVSLATTAADTARTIDLDAVRLVDGAIDLDAIDQLAPVLDRTERAIERAATRIAEVRDPWLIPFVDERLADLADRLDGALPAARMAHLAAVEGPELLGADAPVRWLVALVTPAEARGLGGLLGSYATVTAADGVIEIESIGRNEDVNELLASIDPVLEGSDDYVSRWGPYRPQEFFQDVTMSPDLPDVAEVMASLYEQATGDHVDGVMVADPHVVGAILDLTGPITATGGVVRRLDSDNAVDYLLRGQYADFADDEVGRVVLLASIIESTFDALTSGRLPGPRGLAAELGPLIDQDRLGAWWAGGGRAAELFAAAGLDGAFPRPDGSDLLAVVHQNSGQNKIDVFLRRSIRYEIEHLDGRTRATVTVDLTNTAPRTGLPDSVIGNNDQDLPTGTNAMLLSVYTALDVDGVLVDGVPANVRREREFGYEVATLPLTIPAGRTVTLQVEVTGIVERSDQLIVAQQPLVDDDRLTVVVDGRLMVDDEALGVDRVIALGSPSGT